MKTSIFRQLLLLLFLVIPSLLAASQVNARGGLATTNVDFDDDDGFGIGGGLRVIDVTDSADPREVWPCTNEDPCA